MKAGFVLIGTGLVAAMATAAAADPQQTMKFTSIPITEKVGSGEHKIFPYRIEDKVVVTVQDPIACGQRPINPRFELKGNKLVLRYDLTKAPSGTAGGSCTAHSTFEIENMPHQDLEVSFAGGQERFIVASMVRCPNTKPVVDIYDCLVPRK